MRYIVTGGAGFIGSNIAQELVRQGQEVVVVDNLSTGKKENISENIEFINADICRLNELKKAFRGADFVLHQAALPSVQRSVENPIATTQNNVLGTLNVLLAAKDSGVKKVVYASSSSIYGDTPVLPKKEDMMPNPKSPYAASKLAGEYYCSAFNEVYGLKTVSLRYFNVFGPKQDPDSMYAAVIPRFIRLMLDGKQPVIFGDGEQSRDFSFVSNVVDANLLACKSNAVGIFNIACGQRITVNQLVDKINKILGKSIKAVHDSPRKGDVKHSLADISGAKRAFGYEPRVNFEEGLKKTVGWFKNG